MLVLVIMGVLRFWGMGHCHVEEGCTWSAVISRSLMAALALGVRLFPEPTPGRGDQR